MVEITIFELNLDSADFTANAPGSTPADDEPPDADDESGGGLPTGLALAAVVALVATVVAVAAAKRLRGGEAEPSVTAV